MQVSNIESSRIQLGKIERVSHRDIWPNEEKDFTPWLDENIEQLSQVIGIPIKVQRTEQRVGNYELDIYAQNEDDGTVVVIENQLGQTDHKHLGQLIAYAAGLEAGIIIWVVAEVREEHRSAIEWLNRSTVEQVSLFLVRVEVIRIEDSLPGVQFIIEARPSEFERTLGGIKARSASISPTSIIWSDLPNSPITVSTWKSIFRRTLERAIEEGFEIQSLPVKVTQDDSEADEFRSAMYFEKQRAYVESHGSAKDLRRKISNILLATDKPQEFLRIKCDDGTVFELPQ